MRVDPDRVRRFRAPLLRWYRRRKRDLPWRRTTDPYAIWVSEAMLQQTTVAAVVPYWERFLHRFPDVAALSRASEDEVLAVWSGLGYYRRARALREGALAVMERHGGRVPDDAAALRELPGIGRYTAGAIASLAFGREEPVVDGNVARVVSRWLAARERGAALDRTLWEVAGILVRGPRPGELNQAVMELGATVCTPRSPACEACPVRTLCRARALGRQESFPPKRSVARPREVAAAAAWIERDGAVLVVRKPAGGVLRGAWDLPAISVADGADPRRALAALVRRHHGLAVRLDGPAGRIRHAILAERLTVDVFPGSVRGAASDGDSHRWIPTDSWERAAVSSATLKIARLVAAGAQKRSHRTRVARAASSSSAAASGSSGRRRR